MILVLSEDELGSDWYLIFDDEYIFVDDEDNLDINKFLDKDRYLLVKRNNNDVKNVFKREEEVLKFLKLIFD